MFDADFMHIKNATADIRVNPISESLTKVDFQMNFDAKFGLLGVILAKLVMKPKMKEVGGLGYDPVLYFPMKDVKREFFRHSNTRSNCYLKGETIY